MAKYRCPHDGRKLYPMTAPGIIHKENKNLTMVDEQGNKIHPVMAMRGYQTILTCRYCGYKIPKIVAQKIEEKVGPRAP